MSKTMAWCAGGLLALAMSPVAAAELGVLAPVLADGQPQVQADPAGRPAPVVTRVTSGALYEQVQREARDGFVATVLALDESAQRIAGARTRVPTWLYLSAEDGGFARRGFWLEENGRRRFVDELFVDLVVDADIVADGGFEEIFTHEMGHVFLRRLMPGLPYGWSRTPHSSMSVTDYPTAFDEGFATHFQGLVRRYSRNPRLENLTLGLDAKPFVPFWLSNLDRAGRIDGVRRNLFVQQQLVPSGSDAEAWSRANESTAFDMARLKNGQQMMSSEGVIATLFYRWLVPGEGSREAIVARYSQLFRTLARSDGWTIRSDSPVFLDVVDHYCADVPADCARVRGVVLDTTYGATADAAMPRATEAMAERGRIGDMAGFIAGLKPARAQMAQLQARVAQQPALLRATLGPDLWLLGRTPVKLPGMPSQDVAVNLNTAEAEQLRTLPGIDAAIAQRALLSRREEGVFADVADFARRAGLDAAQRAALESAARALEKDGLNERR
ncbi:helix-hairpin-helix domain-containing protein [Lysobacter sp. MMG2]|uniref:ComEA family DNA-binding protein n=1 Tax=Lysobacter sp. MMG2 TaxID=2801338 RepID=UPI001C23A086|nr:helix-hairpin-helix domain-containing protein [Lysobacter sp. MMG2]MBU8974822.1 helix-hairpin-helix domain-containing protein [Lysobacter sp. MMG2]